MSVTDKSTLKTYFDDGSRPTGSHFEDLIDSLSHIDSGFANGGNAFGTDASIGTTDNNSLEFKTNDLTRLTIANSGNIQLNAALELLDSTYKSALDVPSANILRIGSSFQTINYGSSTQTFTYSNTGGISHNLLGGALQTGTGFRVGRTANITHASGTAIQLATTGVFAPSSGNGSWHQLDMRPSYNQIGTAIGTIRGIYYNPSISSILGAHNAWESTSGDIVTLGEGHRIFFGGKFGISSKLCVTADSTWNNILSLNNSSGVPFIAFRNDGVSTWGNNRLQAGGTNTLHLFGGQGNNHIYLMHNNTAPTTGTVNIVTIRELNNNNFAPDSGSANLTGLLIDHRLNQTGTASGTIRGIYYNPTITSLLGTHYAFESTSGHVRFGGSSSVVYMDDLHILDFNGTNYRPALTSTSNTTLTIANSGYTTLNIGPGLINLASASVFDANGGTTFRAGTSAANVIQINRTTIPSSASTSYADLSINGAYVPTSNSGGDYASIRISSTWNQTGTANQTIRGIYYNPTVTSVLGEHYVLQSTAGKLALAGDMSVGVAGGSYLLTGVSTDTGSSTITYNTNTSLKVGDAISGTGIPSGVTIKEILSSGSAFISANATETNSGLTITVTPQLVGSSFMQSTSKAGSVGVYINPVFTSPSTSNRALLVGFGNGFTTGAGVEIVSASSEKHLILTGSQSGNTSVMLGIGRGGSVSNGFSFYSKNGTTIWDVDNNNRFRLVQGLLSAPTTGLTISGSGGGATATTSISLLNNGSSSGNMAHTIGTAVLLNLGSATSAYQFIPTSGTGNYTILNLNGLYNQTGTANGTIRGIYYNPTVTSVLGAHNAFESTSGDIKFGGASQRVYMNDLYILDQDNSTYKSALQSNTVSGRLEVGYGYTVVRLVTGSGGGWQFNSSQFSAPSNGTLLANATSSTDVFNFTATNNANVGFNFRFQSGRNETSGTYAHSQFSWNHTSSSASTANYTSLQFVERVEQYSGSTGTITSIDINPNLASLAGTYYGLRSRVDANPTGGGTAWNIYADGSAANYFGGDIINKDTNAIYLGDPETDGTYRIKRDGNNLVTERRESGTYVVKQTITA